MFNDLNNLSIVRTRKQAFGFYVAWLITLLIFSMIGGAMAGVFGMVDTSDPFLAGVKVGGVVALVFCSTFAFTIAHARKFKFIPMVLATLGTFILAGFGGGLFGMIIPAYLTTRVKEGESRDSSR